MESSYSLAFLYSVYDCFSSAEKLVLCWGTRKVLDILWFLRKKLREGVGTMSITSVTQSAKREFLWKEKKKKKEKNLTRLPMNTLLQGK